MNVGSLIRASIAVAVGYAVYRGVRSFLHNDITLSVTELVHLPPSDRMIIIDGNVSLEGRIHCETYLMRSYRFLLKLSANIQCASTSPPSARGRPRVMQATDSGSYRTLSLLGGSKRREGLPVILVGESHPMVDVWEIDQSGSVAFTPACISDELMLKYEGTVKDGYPINAAVRNCYVQPDDNPGLKRLSFELVVNDVVHGAKVRITLPNRYCEVVRIHTGGVGHVVQPNPRKPQQLLWQIGTVDKTTWQHLTPMGPDVNPEARLARRGFTDDDLAAAAEREESASVANTYSVLPEWSAVGFAEKGAEDEDTEHMSLPIVRQTSGLPSGAPLLIANFYIVFEEPDGVKYDYVSSDDEAEDEGRESDEAKGRAKSIPNRAAVGAVVGAGGSGPISRKAAKREERARRRQQQHARSADARLTAGCGVSTRLPVVELTYSVVGLASGVSVRKLQTLCDRPNWAGVSLLDLWVLRWIFPGLHQRQLGKYAHYTTWFVQSIPVSTF